MIVSDFLLFTVFGLLFFMESILLSGRGTVIVYSHLLRKWEYTISVNLPFLGGKHFSIRTLFPPLGASFITGSYPLIITSSGLILNPYEGRYSSSCKNFYRYSDIQTAGVSGTKLLINDKSFCTMHSESEALWWKEKIISIAKCPFEERENEIEQMHRSMFDTGSSEALIKNILIEVKPLRLMVNLLYMFLFIAAPFTVYLFTFENVLLPVLIILFTLHTVTVYFFCRAYTDVFSNRGFPWSAIISIALYPPALIRSIDYFFKDSMLHFNPSAVSMILMPAEDSKKLISYLIREYTFFNFTSADTFEEEMIRYYRSSMLNGIISLLEQNSIDYDEILAPPPREENIEFYCPRCFCQYNDKVSKCGDCSIDLKRY